MIMQRIPDAPWIREAEAKGTDYVHDWVFGTYWTKKEENDDEYPEDD